MKQTKKPRPRILSNYMHAVYHLPTFAKILRESVATIKKYQKRHKIDAIAFTGTSGAALAYPLSLRLKLPLICVRKEKSHARLSVEGNYSATKYLIVDDFISSGKTIKSIRQKIAKELGVTAQPAAILLYNVMPYINKKYDGIPLLFLDPKKMLKK